MTNSIRIKNILRKIESEKRSPERFQNSTIRILSF